MTCVFFVKFSSGEEFSLAVFEYMYSLAQLFVMFMQNKNDTKMVYKKLYMTQIATYH